MKKDLLYTAKIEQTWDYPHRMKYVAETDSFIEKEDMSLSYYRNVKQPYGWIKESGTPPQEHLDVMIMTDSHFELGDEVPVRIIGVFCRSDGDNKFVAVETDRQITDFSELSQTEIDDCYRLYKPFTPEEGWFGRDRAEQEITAYENTPKRKIIIMVQHTESEHHVNGHMGGQSNWNLTEKGKEQARNIGKWLKQYEGCQYSFKMYYSDLPRAAQTAEGINEPLNIPAENMIKSKLLWEFNLGEGNGKPRDWYKDHAATPPKTYDPDFRSLPDAECDTEFYARLKKFADEILSNKDERILIVSHGGALGMLQSILIGGTIQDIPKRVFMGHAGGVTRFVIQPNGQVEIDYFNLWVC